MSQYEFRIVFKQFCFAVLGVVGLGFGGRGAIARNVIIPNGTTNSIVSPLNFDPSSSVDAISGGAIEEGNILHSFQEFNVEEGKSAYFFTNPANIENIFSRVAGNNISEVFGTLGTFGNSIFQRSSGR